MDCLPQGDFRPAETRRDPSGDQLQHKFAGVTTTVRHVIGKLDADPPLFCHHRISRRCACRKAEDVGRRSLAKLSTYYAARRIAANVAKLPDFYASHSLQ
jgi:hypothetical protein